MSPDSALFWRTLAAWVGGIGTVLAAVGGVGYKLFDDQLKDARAAAAPFRYFGGRRDHPTADRDFLNIQDRAKASADRMWLSELGGGFDSTRVRVVNDYTFRAYQDLHDIEQAWFDAKGRYFQGKRTMSAVPDFRENRRVELGFGLTDQVDDWRDVGYQDEYAPILLRVDVYSGPKGHGFIVTAEVKIDGQVWQNQMHEGPEDRGPSFIWTRQPQPMSMP